MPTDGVISGKTTGALMDPEAADLMAVSIKKKRKKENCVIN